MNLDHLLDGFSDLRLLVVGDMMLDEYLWGGVTRISPEAPVPVVDVKVEHMTAGGAGNVARNVAAMGAGCFVSSVVGNDRAGRHLRDLLGDVEGWLTTVDRPTTHKIRVVARQQQLVRVDSEITVEMHSEVLERVAQRAERELPHSDGLILSDYGKGLLTPTLARRLVASAKSADVPVFVDPKRELEPYSGARLIKPNAMEARNITGRRSLAEAACELRRYLISDIVITEGASGMITLGDELREVSTAAREMVDVQGAGDTALAALALACCAGANLYEAALIANAAAGVVVSKAGTATTTTEEIREALPAVLRAQGSYQHGRA